MSSSSEFSSLTAKSPEKPSTFSQTCSLLSQYIKEKGSFGDLNLGIKCTAETNGSSEVYPKRSTTMNFFPVEDKFDNILTTARPRKNTTSLNFFPQQNAFIPFVAEDDLPKMAHTNSSVLNKFAYEERKSAQMTIFYGGQVFVFDDFPAEKAKDVMSMASKSGSQNHNIFAPAVTHNHQSITSKMVPSALNANPPFSSITPATNSNLIQELSRQTRTSIPGLPIARKASLHRFLEKRKDRIASKAPYQINSLSSGPPKPSAVEGMPWLGLAAPASH